METNQITTPAVAPATTVTNKAIALKVQALLPTELTWLAGQGVFPRKSWNKDHKGLFLKIFNYLTQFGDDGIIVDGQRYTARNSKTGFPFLHVDTATTDTNTEELDALDAMISQALANKEANRQQYKQQQPQEFYALDDVPF